MSSRRVKFSFKSGENVLCFEPDSSKAKVLYDAKILDVSVSTDKKGRKKPSYLIHFLGWNSSWDRVVPESFLLKNSDENRALMKKLERISHRIKSNKIRMKKIDSALNRFFRRQSRGVTKTGTADDEWVEKSSSSSSEGGGDEEEEEELEQDASNNDSVDMSSEEDDSLTQNSVADSSDETEFDSNDEDLVREPVSLDLPDALKRRLERDCYLIKRQRKHLKLPAFPNVLTILEAYVKCFAVNVLCASPDKQRVQLRSQKQQTPDKSIQLVKEMVDGLRLLFDFTLPVCLLYDSEAAQYEEVTRLSLAEQLSPTADSVGEKPAILSDPLTLSSHLRPQQQRRNRTTSCPQTGACDSRETNSNPNESARKKKNYKSEAEEKMPHIKWVTRNSSGCERRPSSSRIAARLTLGQSQAVASVEDIETEEKPSRRGQRGTRRRSRCLDDAAPVEIQMAEGMRLSPRMAGTTSATLKAELCGALHQHFGSDQSEASSHITQILLQNEVKGFSSQKEKEVNSIVAWRLVPKELESVVPAPPSLVYGAHHLLRLFVRLPDIIGRMELQPTVQMHLVEHLQRFLEHLTTQSDELFPESSYTG